MKNTYKFLFGTMILAASMVACTPEEFGGMSEDGVPEISQFQSQVKVEADLMTNEITATYTGDETENFFWLIVPAKGKQEIIKETTWTKKYKNAGNYEVSFFVMNRNGMSDPIKNVVTLEKDMTGFYGFDPNGADNLWNKASVSFRSSYYAHGDGWEGYEDGALGHTEGDNLYKVTLPYESNMQWQAQYQLNTGLDNSVVPADATYDMSCIVNSTKDLKGMTIKLTDDNDAAAIVDQRIDLVAGEDYVFYILDQPGIDLSAAPLKLVFDFGGCAAETEVIISSICIIDHSKNTELDKVPADDQDPIVWDESANMLSDDCFGDITTYYSHGDAWEAYDEYPHSYAAGVHKITLPNPTDLRWQAQYTVNNTALALSGDGVYDFRLKVVASKDIKGMTVKLTQQDNDDIFLTEGQHDVTADEECWIELGGLKTNTGGDITNLKIVFDFGGNEGGVDIVLSEMLLQSRKGGVDIMPSGALSLASTYVANNDWAEFDNKPKVEINGNDALITFTEANGSLQWQGQFHFNTGVAIAEGKKYDFAITLTPTQDIAGATVKPHPEGDDGHFFSEGRHDLSADEDNVVKYKGFVADFSTDNLVITLDFPSCAAGTTIAVSNIAIIEY